MEFTQISRKLNTSTKKIQLFNEMTDMIALRKLIFKTIEISYSAYYEDQVVQYLKDFQQCDDIRSRARRGNTFLCFMENRIVGTGTLVENRIEAVYIDPALHCHGVGKKIMYTLLHSADIQGYEKVSLEATPGSITFFERLGFKPMYDVTHFVDDIHPVIHHIMEKQLR